MYRRSRTASAASAGHKMAGTKTSLLLEACKLTDGWADDMMLRFSVQTKKRKPRWVEQNQKMPKGHGSLMSRPFAMGRENYKERRLVRGPPAERGLGWGEF